MTNEVDQEIGWTPSQDVKMDTWQTWKRHLGHDYHKSFNMVSLFKGFPTILQVNGFCTQPWDLCRTLTHFAYPLYKEYDIYTHTHISFSFDFLLPVLRTIQESCMKVTDWTLLDMDALQYIHNGRKDWFGLLHDILNRDLCSRFLFWHFKENCGIYYLCFFYMLLVRMIWANIFFFLPRKQYKKCIYFMVTVISGLGISERTFLLL